MVWKGGPGVGRFSSPPVHWGGREEGRKEGFPPEAACPKTWGLQFPFGWLAGWLAVAVRRARGESLLERSCLVGLPRLRCI